MGFLDALIILVCVAFLASGIGFLVWLIVKLFTSKSARFWFLSCALMPLLSLVIATYIALTKQRVSLDYQEGVDVDWGRIDFIVLVLFGLIIPSLYLVVAAPLSFLFHKFRSK